MLHSANWLSTATLGKPLKTPYEIVLYVHGLRQESTQRRLLAETDLTYSKAIEMAKGMETAAKEARTLRDTDHNAPVVKKLTATARMGTAMAQTSCYRCGRMNHRSDECKFRHSTCNACGKTGHIAPVCQSKLKAGNGKPGSTRKHGAKKYTKTHMVDNAQELPSSSDGSDNEFQLYRVGKSALTDQIIVPLTLNGQQLDMEVDTGAALSIISEAT
jgi:hypothetical protein